ncbi:TM2 domain-containing protein [Roseimarinus sediminis]|uniref:TM2 domain-containing protein n=1 Tax=Roseimarinus sediminis TaxID=1610899 RepID=UPI003D1FF834
MRKIVLFLAVVMGLLMVQQSHASTYRLDEAAVDQLFDSAIETSMLESGITSAGMSSTDYTVEGKDPMVAILLDFFLGTLGIHRFYLGTEPISGIAYILTCGGFGGIIPLIDLIMLAVNYEDISPYVNNPKFFMWVE